MERSFVRDSEGDHGRDTDDGCRERTVEEGQWRGGSGEEMI